MVSVVWIGILLVSRASALRLQAESADAYVLKSHMDMYSSYLNRAESGPALPSKPIHVLPAEGQKSKILRDGTCEGLKLYSNNKDQEIFREMMGKIKIDDEDPQKPRVACVSYSHKGNRQDQLDSYVTWGQDCDHFLSFSDEQYEHGKTGVTTIEVHPRKGGERNLVGKLEQIFNEVQRRVESKEISFDFLTVSGDDALWIVPNLKTQLATNPEIREAEQSNTPLIYGHIFDFGGQLFASGAGYVLNKAALKVYTSVGSTRQGWAEDVAIASVLSKNHGRFIHAQEPSGEHMMHFGNPMWMNRNDTYEKGWVHAYEGPFIERMHGKKSIDAISSHTALFHYCKGRTRSDMYNVLHSQRACADANEGI